jgi:hypothetical protein
MVRLSLVREAGLPGSFMTVITALLAANSQLTPAPAAGHHLRMVLA